MDKDKVFTARNIDLKSYFESRGFLLEIEGKERYRVKGYGGLIVYGSTFYWFSQNISGNSIDCLMKVFGFSFVEAVNELVGLSSCLVSTRAVSREGKVIKPYVVPEFKKDQRQVFAYLNKTRKIDPEIISWCMKNKLLFQDEKNNCFFPIYDFSGNIIGEETVGTLEKIRFKKFNRSDMRYGFNFIRGSIPERAYFFESAIDLLSFWSLYKNKEFLENAIFVSLGGLKYEAFFYICEVFSTVDVFICVDNDRFGRAFIERLKSKEINKNELSFQVLVPVLKDWNEDLKAKYK